MEGFEGVEIVVAHHLGDVSVPLWAAPSADPAAAAGSTAHAPSTTALLITARPVVDSAVGDGPSSSPGTSFLDLVLATPGRKRIVGIGGSGRHGKTSFARFLGADVNGDCPHRRMTTSCTVSTVLVNGVEQKASVVLSLIDSPGSAALVAEASSGYRLADAVAFCVDCVEGLLPHAEALLRQAVLATRRIVLVITKLDRLVAELRLPPPAAYEKLKHIVDTVSSVIISAGGAPLSVQGIVFASTAYDVAFSLLSVARTYAETFAGVNPRALANKLWGSVTFDSSRRCFVPSVTSAQTSFVKFVLEPFYKTFATALAHPTEEHRTVAQSAADALRNFFGDSRNAVVDALSSVAPPSDAPPTMPRRLALLQSATTGHSLVGECAFVSSINGVVYVATRVHRGELRSGQSVKASWRPNVAEICAVEKLFVFVNGALVPRDKVGEGVVALIPGALAARFDKILIIVDEDSEPVEFTLPAGRGSSFARVAIEPKNHADLVRLKAGLKELSSKYSGCDLVVEETGEHVIEGVSELALDILLFDLRRTILPKQVGVNLSDPFVAFRETVSAQQGLLRTAVDGEVRIEMTAGALDRRLSEEIEAGEISVSSREDVERALLRHGWDRLDAQRWMGLGPDANTGACSLVEDLLDGGYFPADVAQSVVKGFRLATRRGPLCGEPMRDVKFSVVDFTMPRNTAARATPLSVTTACSHLARTTVRTSFLSAAPRLLEPIASIDIIVPLVRIKDITPVVQRRRGVVNSEVKIPATPLTLVRVLVPLIDSFGLETELRMITQGDARLSTSFDHWAMVPGDPFDELVQLRPLQAAHGYQLARDFVLKTRRRKGLAGTVEMS